MANCINTKELTKELRKRISDEKPLDGEDFFTEEETLVRFLKAREWNLDAAEKQLRDAITWRRTFKPLTIDCSWCHDQPGYHSMRQVGFDELGRPVIYSCFAQADSNRNSVEDSVAHCTYLIENAKKTMRPGVTTWIFVIDCTGISLPCCNPNLGSGVVSVFSNFYPEYLEKIVCINHSTLFHGVWSAAKVFIDPKTVQKMKFIRGKDKIARKFPVIFGNEMAKWLIDEVRLNKQEPLSESQVKFWEAPMRPGLHDPRGSPSYVETCLDTFFQKSQKDDSSFHKPHPNVCEYLTGVPIKFTPRSQRKESKKKLDVTKDELDKHGVKLPPNASAEDLDSLSDEEN